MKFVLLALTLISVQAFAQDPQLYHFGKWQGTSKKDLCTVEIYLSTENDTGYMNKDFRAYHVIISKINKKNETRIQSDFVQYYNAGVTETGVTNGKTNDLDQKTDKKTGIVTYRYEGKGVDSYMNVMPSGIEMTFNANLVLSAVKTSRYTGITNTKKCENLEAIQ